MTMQDNVGGFIRNASPAHHRLPFLGGIADKTLYVKRSYFLMTKAKGSYFEWLPFVVLGMDF